MGPLRAVTAEEEPWNGTRFVISTLNDYMDIISEVVGVLNGVAVGLFVILLLITMVGLVNTFRMIMIERTREIGSMRAMGTRRRTIRSLFLLEALFLALRGAAAGIAAAEILCLAIGAIPFRNSGVLAIILHHGHISAQLVPSNILLVTALLTATTLLSAWFPAGKAARLQPADALRSMA
jgi:putative ABC transport system permease protein